VAWLKAVPLLQGAHRRSFSAGCKAVRLLQSAFRRVFPQTVEPCRYYKPFMQPVLERFIRIIIRRGKKLEPRKDLRKENARLR
jgi:hypothetical protein